MQAYQKKLNFEDSSLSINIPGVSLYENFISEQTEQEIHDLLYKDDD